MPHALFTCNSFTFYTATTQAEDFAGALTESEWSKLASAGELFTIALRTGSPPAGRVEKVRTSTVGLFELKITAPGSKGPQLRMLCVVEGKKVLCVRGVDKRQPKLSSSDIKEAEKAVIERRRRNERARKGKTRKKRGG